MIIGLVDIRTRWGQQLVKLQRHCRCFHFRLHFLSVFVYRELRIQIRRRWNVRRYRTRTRIYITNRSPLFTYMNRNRSVRYNQWTMPLRRLCSCIRRHCRHRHLLHSKQCCIYRTTHMHNQCKGEEFQQRCPLPDIMFPKGRHHMA